MWSIKEHIHSVELVDDEDVTPTHPGIFQTDSTVKHFRAIYQIEEILLEYGVSDNIAVFRIGSDTCIKITFKDSVHKYLTKVSLLRKRE